MRLVRIDSIGQRITQWRQSVAATRMMPPGHALILTLGALIDRRIARHGWVVIAVVAALALARAVDAWSTDSHRFGVLLCAAFAYVLRRGPARSLYAVMFVLAPSIARSISSYSASCGARSRGADPPMVERVRRSKQHQANGDRRPLRHRITNPQACCQKPVIRVRRSSEAKWGGSN